MLVIITGLFWSAGVALGPLPLSRIYSVRLRPGPKCGAPADVSGLPRDTIKFTALKSLSGVAAETVGCIVPVSTF